MLLVNGATELHDSIKMSQDPFLKFSFTIEDDDDWHELRVLNLSKGWLRYQGKIINDHEVSIPQAMEGELEYEATEAGSTVFLLEVTDPSRQAASVEVTLLVFENLAPVAMLQLTQTDAVSPHQIRIDGTQSYDPDHRWNGRIALWEFTIVDFYTTTTRQPVLEYIFPQAGSYSVQLRVQDNDGAWSERVEAEIVVQ